MNYIATITDQLSGMWREFIQMLPSLVIALVILIITAIIAKFAVKLADKIVGHSHMRASLQQLVETCIKIVIWIIGLLIAAAIVLPGFSAGSMIAGLGIGAVAIGFAFQDIFENFLAGVLIMLREKMRIGDVIECEGIRGRVEQITLRETYVRQLSNELTIVPNSMLFKNPVEIETDDEMRRDALMVGVAYETDLDAAEKALHKAFDTAIEGIVADKDIDVFAREFGGSSIDWEVRFWCASSKPRDMRLTRTRVVKAIKREFDAAGIDIPFPIQTNYFAEPLKLVQENG